LKRSIKTLQIVLEQLNISYVLEIKDYHLNERHYGALQGKSKTECAQKFGEEQVQIWRRNPSVRPPKVEKNDIINYPKFDRRYEMIPEELLPQSESFEDAFNRFIPFWKEKILPLIQKQKKIVIVAHGTIIRCLIKELDMLSLGEIEKINVPQAIPILFQFDRMENGNFEYKKKSFEFIGASKEQVEMEIKKVANQGKINKK